MKKSFLPKPRWLVTIILLTTLCIPKVYGDTKKETFESATTDNTYTMVHTISTSQSSCGIAWTMLGTPSTSSAITGSNSVALRLYSTTSTWPYLATTTAISGLTQVSFKAKAQTSNSSQFKIDVMYSTNSGSTWSYMKMTSSTGSNYKDQTPSTSATTYTAYVPSGVTGSFLFKIAVTSNSTKPTKSNSQCTIDEVTFTYTAAKTVTLSGAASINGSFFWTPLFRHTTACHTSCYNDEFCMFLLIYSHYVNVRFNLCYSTD